MKNETRKINGDCLPPLPLAEWQTTRDTLHLWTQIVGKIRLVQTPLVNHWWNVLLYVSPRGLTTSANSSRRRFLQSGFQRIYFKV